MKKLFALFAVAALAAVGCDDKKTSGGTKTNASSGGTYVQTNKATVDVLATVKNTVVVGTDTATRTRTEVGTATVTKTPDRGGPGPDLGKGGKDGR